MRKHRNNTIGNIKDGIRGIFRWILSTVNSGLIAGVLLFIVVNFYIFSSIVNLDSFFYAFLLLSLLTDGLFTFIHLPRRFPRPQKRHFEPHKLTVVIASHNGEAVIEATIKGAQKHVPSKQILVVSDASTDNTAELAYKMGVRVLINKKNLHKVGSINAAMNYVNTPYVLIVDDDTLIGDTFIPTSLLDEGYTAVAFNVMPVPRNTLLNELQVFEYRRTMQIGKRLRAAAGAIGNISGAIGLYRTTDLRKQVSMHSGQFVGEDEQRTLLAHMYGEGKGIAYANSLVLTEAPRTYRELYKQRAYSWSIAAPELLFLYFRILFSTKYHYTLKAEKAYQIYQYLTDPLRILFLWTLIMKPSHLVYTYGFYVALNFAIWLRMGAVDRFRAVLLTPLFSLGLTICRFVGYFYWFRVKAEYFLRKKHKAIIGRKLVLEYMFIFSIIAGSWYFSIVHFQNDLHLFNSIRAERLSDNKGQFNYESSTGLAPVLNQQVGNEDKLVIQSEAGDSPRSIADKALQAYISQNPLLPQLTNDQRWKIDKAIAKELTLTTPSTQSAVVVVSKNSVHQALLDVGIGQ